jgi:membrane protease YdiL (CAAX protease family)
MAPDTSTFPERPAQHGVAAGPPPPRDDDVAAALRGFGPLGVLAIAAILLTGNVFVGNMLVLPVGATLVLLWAWRSRTPWHEIGYARPRRWALTIVGGIVFGVALKFAMKAIVMPLLGADPVNQAFRFLTGNTAMLPTAIWAMFVAGFGEETVFRGFVFERFGKLLGTGPAAKALAVLITSAWFGIGHYGFQGVPGVQQATIVGLLFGGVFAMTGRLWMLMIAHTAFDLTALVMIYLNLETAVARSVFE